jgi:hypothetical protein
MGRTLRRRPADSTEAPSLRTLSAAMSSAVLAGRTLSAPMSISVDAPGTVNPSDRYVRVGAAAGGNGQSWATAWNSFDAINWTQVNGGMTVWIAGGTYGGLPIRKSGTSDTNRITFKKATAAEHGTNTGWSNAYDTQVVIVGGIHVSDGTYQTERWITIDGSKRDSLSSGHGIWCYGASNAGIWANYGSDGLTIRYCEIGHASTTLHNGEDGIQGYGDDLLIEYCYIHDNDNGNTHGDGIQWMGGNRITIRYNMWRHNGQGIYLGELAFDAPCYDVNIYYNLFSTRATGSIYDPLYALIFYRATGTKVSLANPQRINVWNNTFDMQQQFILYLYPSGWDTPTLNIVKFQNNAIYNSAAYGFGGATNSHNAYDNAGQGANTSVDSGTNSVFAGDLGFVSVGTTDANPNYDLLSTSPMRGKGTPVNISAVDILGRPVPTGSTAPDIGCFQYSP